MRKILQKILAGFARRIIRKYHPTVIGITGSVGKTSAKEAIFLVVRQKFRARKSEKNFNNETGLPLTIMGSNSQGKNVLGWLGVFIKAFGLIIFRQKYPEVLVLEYGIDRPGDMDYLLSIAKPTTAVITSIGVSHYEFFRDAEGIETEKSKLVENLAPGDYCILNADNEKALACKNRAKARVTSYGINPIADVSVSSVTENFVGRCSTALEIKTSAGNVKTEIRAIGIPHVSAVLSAAAVGSALGVSPELIAKGLREYRPVPGRLNVIPGARKSFIIDDSYNAAPDSVKEALDVLVRMPGEHKIAVLGDMLELGNLSDREHTRVGEHVAKMNANHLVTVGPSGKIIAEGALAAGLPEERIVSFDTSEQAKVAVVQLIREGSVILVKGSQGVRLEKITKEILAEPMRSGELLCRQYGKWLEN